MSLINSLPILILMLGAALLAFILAWAWLAGKQEAINAHRLQLMEEVNNAQTENNYLNEQLNQVKDERHSWQNQVSEALTEKQLLQLQIHQLEKEKAFIIREFHELKAEMKPGDNVQLSRLFQEKEDQEEMIEELKKTVVLLNNELNAMKDKTSVNPSKDHNALKQAKDILERFK